MIRIDPFKADDAMEIVLNARGAALLTWHDRRALGEMYARSARGLTARDADSGQVLACCGNIERHVERTVLWALYAEGITLRQWGWILNRTRHYVDGLPHRRVEAEVRADDMGARRWIERCGMTREAVLAQAAPDGGDMLLYRRVEP